MRLLRLTTNYPAYLADFYRLRPGLASQPYQVQHDTLMRDRYGWNDAWSAALGGIGYQVMEVVANAGPLQKAWAREHDMARSGRSAEQIVLAQLLAFAPEIVFISDHSGFGASFLRQVRAALPRLRLMIAWCGSPFTDGSIFREVDAVVSCIPEQVHEFTTGGIRSHLLAHAFDHRLVDELKPAPQLHDFTFIGSIVRRSGYHEGRERIIRRLIEATPLEIWSPITLDQGGIKARARAVLKRLIRRDPQSAEPPLKEAIPGGRLHPPLFGLEMYRTLQRSRVTLNTHIDISAQSASNMRLFEATGVGSCLITDWKPDLERYFTIDEEVVTYRSVDECRDKVRELLSSEGRRQQIAAAGRRRTLREHTFDRRAPLLHEMMVGTMRQLAR
jgi:spore maturation protein CgeB